MIDLLLIGSILGLTAGFTPGPLLMLVISETLQHDIKSGIKVALAPIITDLPMIMVTLLISAQLSDYQNILGALSLVGALFVLFLSYDNLSTKGLTFDVQSVQLKSLTKGVLANLLSPYPYLFWFTVGAPIVSKAMAQNTAWALAFVSIFYLLLVGSKILLALLVGKSKTFLSGNTYIYIVRFLGLILAFLALSLFHDGLKMMALI